MRLIAVNLTGHDVPGLARNARASRDAAIVPVENWLELLDGADIPISTYAVVVGNPGFLGRVTARQYLNRIRAARAAREANALMVLAWAS